MKKKIILLTVLTALLLLIYSNQTADDVSILDIESELCSKIDLSSLDKLKDRDLVHFFNIEPSSTEGYLYYKSNESLCVDELLIIKTSSHSELAPFRDAIENRINSQISTFEGYGPEQVSSLEDALIIQKGQYILYYVGDNSEKIEEVFKNAI